MIRMNYVSGSQGVVPRLAASTSVGVVGSGILGPTLALLNQTLCEWSPAICGLTSSPGDSDVHLGLRNMKLMLKYTKNKICLLDIN